MNRRDFQKGALAAALLSPAQKAMAASGYIFPDEAEPHERTFMQWPVSRIVHPDRYFLQDLQGKIAELANVTSEFEPVVMLMDSGFTDDARRQLSNQVEIWNIPTDDLWARDSGPVFVRNPKGELAVQSVNFNGWGNKQIHGNDGKIAKRIAERLDLPYFNNGLVGEAGGVERAPDGVLLANRSSWVNPNRNAGSEDDIENKLLDAFGGTKMIWSDGVYGLDITDDHIDATARFVSAEDIVVQLPEKSEDPFSQSAHRLYEVLQSARNAAGQPYRLHVINEPYDTRVQSEDFVASYVNYYLCNGALIMPQFGDAQADQEAQERLASLYPEREIVALNIDEIGEVGGGIHCATQQQPKGS